MSNTVILETPERLSSWKGPVQCLLAIQDTTKMAISVRQEPKPQVPPCRWLQIQKVHNRQQRSK